MLKGASAFWLFLVLIVGVLVGLSRRDAQTQDLPETAALTEIQSPVVVGEVSDDLLSDAIDRDFYQTIIKNNLFAPLEANLHAKPGPGWNFRLIATFTTQDPRGGQRSSRTPPQAKRKPSGLVMFCGATASQRYKESRYSSKEKVNLRSGSS